MANNCYFEMKIAGPEKAVEEFIRMLQHKGPGYGLGRVFSFDPIFPNKVERDPATGNIAIEGAGDCAWSLKTSLLDWSPHSLLSETERLGLVVEAYSSEPGLCFQEHILVVRDELKIDECVDYEEYSIDGAKEEYIQDVMEEYKLTREQLMEKVNDNGDFTVGGYENFGDFEDLFRYFEPELKTDLKLSLSDRIASAKSRSAARIEPVGEKGREAEHEIDA